MTTHRQLLWMLRIFILTILFSAFLTGCATLNEWNNYDGQTMHRRIYTFPDDCHRHR